MIVLFLMDHPVYIMFYTNQIKNSIDSDIDGLIRKYFRI